MRDVPEPGILIAPARISSIMKLFLSQIANPTLQSTLNAKGTRPEETEVNN